MKKTILTMLAILVLSLSFALADEDTTEDEIEDETNLIGGPGYGQGNNPGRQMGLQQGEGQGRLEAPGLNPFNSFKEDNLIQDLMEKYELTEDNTIGELLAAIESSQTEIDEEMKSKWLERAREIHDLDDSMSDEEVEEYVLNERRENTIEALDLDEDATDEEILNELLERGPIHKGFFGKAKAHRQGLFNGF